MTTIDDILALDDDTSFAIALSELVAPRRYEDGFSSLTPGERVAYCVDALEGEVNNGGFDQFFFNSSGDTAVETIAALDAIGGHAARAICERAVAAFPGGAPPTNRDARQALLLGESAEAARAAWATLDEAFYAYPDDIAALLRAYVAAHRDDFRPR